MRGCRSLTCGYGRRFCGGVGILILFVVVVRGGEGSVLWVFRWDGGLCFSGGGEEDGEDGEGVRRTGRGCFVWGLLSWGKGDQGGWVVGVQFLC